MKDKCQSIINKTRTFLFDSYSQKRSLLVAVIMLVLYILSYIILNTAFYHFFSEDSGYYFKPMYFPIVFTIGALPVFALCFFKLNIFTSFWKDVSKPKLIDCIFVGAIIIFCFFSFNHVDLTITSVNGKMLVDMIYRGENIFDFYNYNEGSAAYLLPQYIVFGIWSVPVKIVHHLAGLAPIGVNEFAKIEGFTLWWYKLLPTLFYLASAFIIYKIGRQLNISKDKAKWMSLIWIACPVSVFSQFIFGQYDSIGMFFELLMFLFFLKKKTFKFTIFAIISILFKIFPVFIFIPLLLLIEKKIIKIIGHLALVISGYLFFSLTFSNTTSFTIVQSFNTKMFERLYISGINTSFGTLSFFFLALIAVSVFAYFIDLKDLDEFTFQKYAIYIPLFVYSMFFTFVLWHPQWVLILMPYMIINIFMNPKIKRFLILAFGIGFSYLLLVPRAFRANVDANLISNGIFTKIFNFDNSGETFKSISDLISRNEKFPTSIFFSIFAALIIINLILQFPTKKNIEKSIAEINNKFGVEREIIWIMSISVLIFIMPAVLFFFTFG